MNRPPYYRQFRSVTFNMATRKARTMVIMMSLAIAVMVLFVSVIAVQLMAARGSNSFASRVLHSVSNQSLNSIMSREIPLYASAQPNPSGRPKEPRSNLTSILFYLFTDINVEHPETVLGGPIAAMAVSNFEPLTKDSVEHPGEDTDPQTPDRMGPPQTTQPKVHEPSQADGKPAVYIYHTHNRESFLPELNGETDPDKAYDRDRNITLVGERLLKALSQKNIAAIQTKNDYWFKGDIKNEYDLSRKTVSEVLRDNSGLKMVFDIHRDSLPREKTTLKINGKEAARVFFIVGGSNPNFKNNEEFAKRVHNKLQEMYPGLSKGAFTKRSTDYDTRYNQDLFPRSVIIEIGGPDNTLEEAYYTADLLANAIAELMKEEREAAKP